MPKTVDPACTILDSSVVREEGVIIRNNGATELYYDGTKQCETNSGGMNWADGKRAYFGNSSDLQIYHDGSHSYLNNYTGIQFINGNSIYMRNDDSSEDYLRVNQNEGVHLYYDAAKKFETLSDGIRVSGYIYANDSNRLCLGDSADLQLYHNATDSLIVNSTGNLYQRTTGNLYLQVNGGANENAIVAKTNGAVEL